MKRQNYFQVHPNKRKCKSLLKKLKLSELSRLDVELARCCIKSSHSIIDMAKAFDSFGMSALDVFKRAIFVARRIEQETARLASFYNSTETAKMTIHLLIVASRISSLNLVEYVENGVDKIINQIQNQ